MAKSFFTIIICFSLLPYTTLAQTNALRKRIEQVIVSKKATVGVAIYGLESGDILTINGDTHFPMQSVYKFHIALAVLDKVDKRKLSLDKLIPIRKIDLPKNTWSPLAEKYPDQDVKLPLETILHYTVAESDNNGCDILLKLMGGPAVANNYIHSIGIKDVAIRASEKEMRKDWNIQFTNWTTPVSATQLLKLFFGRKILSNSSYSFLWKTMIETSTGPKRIKGQLPPGTPVAHKTGTSATDEHGITAAMNDVGIVTLPNGKHFAISVFVSNSKESDETNEKIIADISKLTWDYFVSR